MEVFFEVISGVFGPYASTPPDPATKGLILAQIAGPGRHELGAGVSRVPTYRLNAEALNRLLTAYGVEATVQQPFVDHFFGADLDGLTAADLRHRVDSFVKVVLWKYGSHLRALRDLGHSLKPGDALRAIPFRELGHTDEEKRWRQSRPSLVTEELTLSERNDLGYAAPPARPMSAPATTARRIAREKGRRNSESFLYSHHVDIYLAGSMRVEEDFAEFQTVAREIREHIKRQYDVDPIIFDPTLCWFPSSADKGLLESLMLKKAEVGVMIAGSSDTFGKDSEAAQLLGQGKPVIVYASGDATAQLFREKHPLRMQVSPSTGVACGITVVRTPMQCAQAVSRLLFHELDVEVVSDYQPPIQLNDPDPPGPDEGSVIALVDRKADPSPRCESVVRVVTKNLSLTRTFWSRYFD